MQKKAAPKPSGRLPHDLRERSRGLRFKLGRAKSRSERERTSSGCRCACTTSHRDGRLPSREEPEAAHLRPAAAREVGLGPEPRPQQGQNRRSHGGHDHNKKTTAKGHRLRRAPKWTDVQTGRKVLTQAEATPSQGQDHRRSPGSHRLSHRKEAKTSTPHR